MKYILAILTYLTIFLSSFTYAQETESELTPLELSLGTIRTELEQAAVGILVDYAETISEEDIFRAEEGWLLDLQRNFKIQTGDEDAFNGVIAKVSGNHIRFSETTLDDGTTIVPNSTKLFHVVPISIGFEADNKFDNLSLIGEVGYIPFHLTSPLRLGLTTKFGVFLQAGYKYGIDDSAVPEVGGSMDESSEDPDSAISRLKLVFDTNLTFGETGRALGKVSVLPSLKYWYDLANSETYYNASAALRFHVGSKRFFDLKYEKGSGEPNFNEGEQFSANLTFQF